MWLVLQDQSKVKATSVGERLTVGTAPSNGLVLEGRGIHPLHGQLTKREEGWVFRDFVSDRETPLLPQQKFPLGPFDCELLQEDALWEKYRSRIVESFRSSLKSSKDFDLEIALQRLKSEIFFSKDLPVSIQDHLESQFQEFSLLSPIERLLLDKEVTDILVEDFDVIWVERTGSLERAPVAFTSEESFRIYVENLLSQLHKSVDEAHPFADFVLRDGSRGHVIAPPLTPKTYYLSIRKPRNQIWLLDDLQDREMMTQEQRRLINQAIDQKMNILVSGSTGSGKTTLLKALIAGTQSQDRILILEDTPELGMSRKNTGFLRTRLDVRSELPPIALRDLVRQCLRMRPDRIVIGEVRGEEALDLLHAMNTGHRGCMGSLHANSSRDAVSRLEGLVQLAEQSLSESATRDLVVRNIHLVIHCAKINGQRKVQEIGFVRGLDGERLLMEVLL